jgi:hypothetical protein
VEEQLDPYMRAFHGLDARGLFFYAHFSKRRLPGVPVSDKDKLWAYGL